MSPRRVIVLALALLLPQAVSAWPGWGPQDGPKGAPPVDVANQCEDLAAEPITYGMIYDEPGSGLPGDVLDMHDIWLAGGCVGCHNSTAMGGLRLDQPDFGAAQLVYQASFRDSSLIRVTPGDNENSLLYAMLNCAPPVGYPTMPPPTDGMSQRINRALRAKVYDWIEQGARGTDGDGNPVSLVVFRDAFESTRQQRNLIGAPPPQ